MSHRQQSEKPEVSRRAFVEWGALSGLSALAALSGGVETAQAQAADASDAQPNALGPARAGLTYFGIDALAFFPTNPTQRIYQDQTGVQGNANDRIWAPLMLPTGSTISQISASYQVQPIIEISRRPMFSGTTATAPVQVYQQSLPASPGGPFASTLNISPPVVISANATYLVSAFLTPGSSIIGVQIGYRPPTQSFVPFTGSTPRVFSGPLTAGQAKNVALGRLGIRSGVFNLTVSGSSQAGQVTAFPANLTTPPARPSVQYAAGQKIENLVISGVDGSAAISLLATTATNAAVDLIGYLI